METFFNLPLQKFFNTSDDLLIELLTKYKVINNLKKSFGGNEKITIFAEVN